MEYRPWVRPWTRSLSLSAETSPQLGLRDQYWAPESGRAETPTPICLQDDVYWEAEGRAVLGSGQELGRSQQ